MNEMAAVKKKKFQEVAVAIIDSNDTDDSPETLEFFKKSLKFKRTSTSTSDQPSTSTSDQLSTSTSDQSSASSSDHPSTSKSDQQSTSKSDQSSTSKSSKSK